MELCEATSKGEESLAPSSYPSTTVASSALAKMHHHANPEEDTLHLDDLWGDFLHNDPTEHDILASILDNNNHNDGNAMLPDGEIAPENTGCIDSLYHHNYPPPKVVSPCSHAQSAPTLLLPAVPSSSSSTTSSSSTLSSTKRTTMSKSKSMASIKASPKAAAPRKRRTSSTSLTRKTSEQVIEKRRERNREHAKRSRIRKKSFSENLQKSVALLQEENDKLKQKIVQHLGAQRARQLLQQLQLQQQSSSSSSSSSSQQQSSEAAAAAGPKSSSSSSASLPVSSDAAGTGLSHEAGRTGKDEKGIGTWRERIPDCLKGDNVTEQFLIKLQQGRLLTSGTQRRNQSMINLSSSSDNQATAAATAAYSATASTETMLAKVLPRRHSEILSQQLLSKIQQGTHQIQKEINDKK